jgi:hypothetical protein
MLTSTAEVRLLTCNGLGWTDKYPAIVKVVSSLDAHQAYQALNNCVVAGGPGRPGSARNRRTCRN